MLKKCFLSAAFPQRLEAAVEFAAVAARVELVPFPVVLECLFAMRRDLSG